MFLDYFALGLLVFVVIFIFYGVIAIHDIPYEISKKRNHPHQDAIHVAGWVSLFTLHVLWPFLWIWATLYKPDRGWGMLGHTPQNPDQESGDNGMAALHHQLNEINQRLTALENTGATQADEGSSVADSNTSENGEAQ